MTESLYLEDSRRRTVEATVERVVDDRVVLDRTVFYPEGGGQPADTGTLRVADDGATGDDGGTAVEDARNADAAATSAAEEGSRDAREWAVTDVQKRDTIYHDLEPAAVADGPPTAGTTVVGELDWGRRWAHMRYHTAQHLLSAVVLAEYDAVTTGNQLYADRARLDCKYDRFEDDDLAALETRLNDLVDADLPVRWYELERDVAEERLDPERTRIDLLPDSITEVRIVEIGDEDDPFDRTACAGTHVSSTGEIGDLEITGRETAGSGEERVRFRLAGT